MTRYRFITIEQIDGASFNKRPVYNVYNNKNKKELAALFFYAPWRQYVFNSKEDCVFSNECLRDVLKFMNEIDGDDGEWI